MSEIKVKVLGTVTPYCTEFHNCPGFLIYVNGKKIMLDCGNGITGQMSMPNDLKNLNVIISHLHFDHYGELSALIGAIHACKKAGIYYGNTNYFIPRIFQDDIECQYIRHIIGNSANSNITEYNENSLNIIKGINISFIKNYHSITTYCTKIENDGVSLVYTSDTGNKNIEKLISFSYKSDLLICDSTFIKDKCKNSPTHLHAHEAAILAKEAKVNKLLLTHFLSGTDKQKYVDEAREIFENVEAAEEGMILTLSR